MRLLEATAVRYDAGVCLSLRCSSVLFFSSRAGQQDEESAADHNPC